MGLLGSKRLVAAFIVTTNLTGDSNTPNIPHVVPVTANQARIMLEVPVPEIVKHFARIENRTALEELRLGDREIATPSIPEITKQIQEIVFAPDANNLEDPSIGGLLGAIDEAELEIDGIFGSETATKVLLYLERNGISNLFDASRFRITNQLLEQSDLYYEIMKAIAEQEASPPYIQKLPTCQFNLVNEGSCAREASLGQRWRPTSVEVSFDI